MSNKPFVSKIKETEKKSLIFQVLLILSVLYFTLFFFPNITGARTDDMLQVFQVDEYAQYPHVIRMLTPGDTFYQTIRNFLIYLHYFYGYIFYFLSAIVILPLRLALGSDWTNYTPLIVGFLRQGINVAPAIAAVFLLTYIQTGFRSWLRSISLFILMLSIPELVNNNLWWHPDSLGLLLVVLVFFFLERDGLRFGHNFFWAAVCCGLAIGTKYLGVFFVFAIPLYLVYGLANQKITWRRLFVLGFSFLGVMLAAVVISNPLLLLPQERAALIQYQVLQYQQTMGGIILKSAGAFMANGQYPDDFRQNYGDIIFVLITLCALVIGLLRSGTRLRASLLLAFLLPLVYTVATAATQRIHYWIPVMVPLVSCLAFLFPENEPSTIPDTDEPKRFQSLQRVVPWLVIAIIVTQFFMFLLSDYHIYQSTLTREVSSRSLKFNRQVNTLLDKLPAQNKKYVAYRDWHIYFPANDRWRVEMNWELTTGHFIEELDPDLILLEKENITLYNSPEAIRDAVNPQDMQSAQKLYQAASTNKLTNYTILYEDSFAVALLRTTLIKQVQ